MTPNRFKIHDLFTVGETGKFWVVTDVGTRTIIGIELEKWGPPLFNKGPPYIAGETVFDESDLEVCTKLPVNFKELLKQKGWI